VTSLVGRAAELERLFRRAELARQGQGGVVFLVGEAGIGKTALLDEFLRRAQQGRSLTVVQARCVEHSGPGEAYLPLLDALGRLLASRARERTIDVLRSCAPTWALHMPADVIRPELRGDLLQRTIGASRERMQREAVDGLTTASADFPFLLALEDAQWADPSTIDAVHLLGAHIARRRVLVVISWRPADALDKEHPLRRCALALGKLPNCEQITLRPLSPDEVAAWLDARYPGHHFPPELAGLAWERTEGHPLFVAALLETLEGGGWIGEPEGAWAATRDLRSAALDLPDTLRSVIRRRLELLDEDDRQALQYGSVMGRELLSSVLARLLEADEALLEERLARLARAHGLLELRGEEELPDGSVALRYRFAHALDQAVLYEDLASRRRALLHGRVAEELTRLHGEASPRIAAVLALHRERGRDFPAAVQALAQAGDNASAVHALGEALGHYDHAILVVERLPAAQRRAALLPLRERRALTQHALGRFDVAIAEYQRLLEEARAEAAQREEWAALLGLCQSLFFARRIEELAVRAHEALGAARSSGDPGHRLDALLAVAQVLLAEGRLRELEPVLAGMIEDARRARHDPALAWGLDFSGFALYFRGRYAESEARFREARAVGARLRDGFVVLASLMFTGLCRGYRGHLSEALACFAEGAEMGRLNADRVWLPRMLTHQGWVHRELQDFERARACHEEALRLARELPLDWASDAEPLLNLSVERSRDGSANEADLAELERTAADAWFGWLYAVRLANNLAQSALLQGDAALGRAHAERLLGLASELGADAYVLAAHHLLAQAALHASDLAQARAHLAEAVRLLEEQPSALDRWKVHATLGRFHRLAGDPVAALHAWREAAAGIDSIASQLDDEALRGRFLASAAVRAVRSGAEGRDA
jgi:tetratricopeptide (TPR) repeat protein